MAKLGRLLITVHLQKFFNKSHTPRGSRVRRWVSGLHPACRLLLARPQAAALSRPAGRLPRVSLVCFPGFGGEWWRPADPSSFCARVRLHSFCESRRLPARPGAPAPALIALPDLYSQMPKCREALPGELQRPCVRPAARGSGAGRCPWPSVTLAVKEDVRGH